MSRSTHLLSALFCAAVAATTAACGDEASHSGATTATAASAATTAPVASTPAASASAPAPTVSAAPAAPRSDCPKGSEGPGTLADPCAAKGKERLMEVTWTGKMDDNGPTFRVQNKSDKTILYGRVVVYFYDKAGKQMDVKGDDGKTYASHGCAGNLFAGVMKPGEKAVITFSCVNKKNVPDDAKAIEAEMQTVGFADASEKKSEYFWKNNNLVPEKRPKGGVK